LNHDQEIIRQQGLTIISDTEADRMKGKQNYTPIFLSDLEKTRIERLVGGFGVPLEFDVIGICAQDHGMPPPGASHLEFRHLMFRNRLNKSPFPHAMLYEAGQVPVEMNRLSAIARTAASFATDRVFVMDSGMAAIVGATRDPDCQNFEKRVVMDIATSHTVCAALDGDALAGFFEFHTRDITPEKLAELTRALTDGNLTHTGILAEGGHGAYIRKAFGYSQTEIFLVTGPKRSLIKSAPMPIKFGAPWGDNMMTGTVGLLTAIQRHLDLAPLPDWI
jgi:uncharacterized protein (DUF1786 family)